MEINLFKNSANFVDLPAGEVLFREGEIGELMYAVVSGSVTLSHEGVGLRDVGPGGIVGEMALIDTSPRSLTASAAEATRVVPVTKADFLFLVQEHPTFAVQVMSIMAERLRDITSRTA